MAGIARTAQCACGRLSVRCIGEPRKVSLCHCLACQRRTGSTYGLAAFFDRGAVQADGARNTFVRPGESGFDVAFHFCPTCGSTVYWEPRRVPDMVAVAVGAFADPAFPAPSQSVHEESRHTWIAPAPR